MSKLTRIEEVTAEVLKRYREGTLPPIPAWLKAEFDAIARRNPDLVAETDAIIRRTIEKTMN